MIQIIGKGGFARELASYIQYSTIDTSFEMFENECAGIKEDIDTVIAIGDGSVRKNISERFASLKWGKFNDGFSVGENKIGKGAIICPGTVITCDVIIGEHCLINLNCTIGHDCIIGDFVTISPGANISGKTTIGDLCYIGTNSVIREKISICDNVVIGAGGVVVKDITEPGVYVGNPVKKIE